MGTRDKGDHAERGRRPWLASALLIVALFATGGVLAAFKLSSIREADAAAASQPEPTESVTVATAEAREHHDTVTSIGTVLATRSITLRNELDGTVNYVALTPGRVVERGAVLLRLDVSVEEAELEAQKARARLAQTLLDRSQQASRTRAVSAIEVDRARAERDVAQAEIARIEAIIARKTIKAPFRARIGLADVHPGQYLDAGTELTTLQGVGEAVHVDFAVPQRVARGLAAGHKVQVEASGGARPQEPDVEATIVATDARVDPATRNALVRARIDGARNAPAPGASVRVVVRSGPPRSGVVVPVNALRKGPSGDHVFVIAPGEDGNLRAHVRPVSSGPVLGEEVLIVEGLEPGERVAASGSFKLRDAALVAVAGPPAGAGGEVEAARGEDPASRDDGDAETGREPGPAAGADRRAANGGLPHALVD